METLFLEELHEQIKLNSFGRKRHLLILNDNHLIFNNTKINLAAISHMKFDVRIMQFGMFQVGRSYHFNLKIQVQEFKLVLRSFLGIQDNYLASLYEKLVNGVWLRIGDRLIEEAITKIKGGNVYRVGTCILNKKGIVLEQNGGLENKAPFVPWSDLSYDKKYDRLVINSKSNNRLWANLYFLEHWNVVVLMDLLDWIFKEGGLAELNPNGSAA